MLGLFLFSKSKIIGLIIKVTRISLISKGNRAFADLRYGVEDTVSPGTLNYPTTKG